MRWVLCACFALSLVGCADEIFEAPPVPDLYKTPRDLGIELPPEDLAKKDDLSSNKNDLSANKDDLGGIRDDLLPVIDLLLPDAG